MPAAIAIPAIMGAVSAGSSIASGVMGSNAASSASKAQQAAANHAADLQKQAADSSLAFQKQVYGDQMASLAPYQGTGTASLAKLADLMGVQTSTSTTTGTPASARQMTYDEWIKTQPIGNQVNYAKITPGQGMVGNLLQQQYQQMAAQNKLPTVTVPSTLQTSQTATPQSAQFGSLMATPTADQILAQDPGYDFRLTEGQKALERAEAAGGNIGSGGALRAATQYGQDYASSEFGNAYNRFQANRQSTYNNLANLAGLGQTANSQAITSGNAAASNISNINGTTASNMGNDYMAAGNATASGYMGAANAWGGAATSLGKIASSTLSQIAAAKGWGS